MGLLDIVNDDDVVIASADFTEAHEIGLRHRSVQVFISKPNAPSQILVAKRSKYQETSAMKYHCSVGGHVRCGEGYHQAALNQLQDEVFHGLDFPAGITLIEIATFKNDTRPTNLENSKLYTVSYDGPFNANSNETSLLLWKSIREIDAGLKKNPDDYTQTFKNSFARYKLYLNP